MDKLLALASEIKKNRNQIKAILETPPEVHHFVGEKGANGSQGTEGVAGIAGAKGANGKDGVAGKDGVSIVDVVLDFDNGLSVELSDGTTIDAGSLNLPKDKQSIVSLKQGPIGSPQAFLNPSFSYIDGVLSGVAYSNGPTKDLSYNLDGSLDTMVTTINGTTNTKTFNYNEDGTLASIT